MSRTTTHEPAPTGMNGAGKGDEMETVTIPRVMAERLCDAANFCLHNTHGAIQKQGWADMATKLEELLSAPAGPLTAEEMRRIAAALRNVRHTNKFRAVGRQCTVFGGCDYAARQIEEMAEFVEEEEKAAIEHAPAWTGPQPVVDGQNE